MRNKALFINGVYETVIKEIIDVQSFLPEQILYLQPHSGSRIVDLSENPPSVDQPYRLFLSTTADLPTIQYTCEIVHWEDKRKVHGSRRAIIETVITEFQKGEGGLYERIDDGPECINLLHIWKMKRLVKPFAIDELLNAKDNSTPSSNRKTAGGWLYVLYNGNDWLDERL